MCAWTKIERKFMISFVDRSDQFCVPELLTDINLAICDLTNGKIDRNGKVWNVRSRELRREKQVRQKYKYEPKSMVFFKKLIRYFFSIFFSRFSTNSWVTRPEAKVSPLTNKLNLNLNIARPFSQEWHFSGERTNSYPQNRDFTVNKSCFFKRNHSFLIIYALGLF